MAPMQFRPKPSAVILCLSLAGIGVVSVSAQTNDLSGQTDVSIRNVLSLVAYHNIVPLADGDYTPVNSFQAATNALKPTGITWSYPWGVALYGMLQASEATGDTNIENFVVTHDAICRRYYNWLESLNTTVTNQSGLSSWQNSTAIGGLMSMSTSSMDGYGAMGAQMMEAILNHTGGIAGTGQDAAGASIANTISTRVGRLPDGTLYRPGSYGGTIWDDDLYMACAFLVRWYEYTGDTNYLSDAAQQIINVAGYNQSTNGLWWHGYFCNTYGSFSHTNSPVKWGRANGWAMVATVEVLSAMPTNYPTRAQLLDILRRHIAGVESVQAPDGMWFQVLDDPSNPSNWEETSCTGMFAYSIARAVSRGWIDPTDMAVAQRAVVALCAHVKTNGVVTDTCEGTDIGTNELYYLQRTHPDDDPHSPGPVMMAGSEILLSKNDPPPPALNVIQSNGQSVISWPAALTNYSLEFSTNLFDWTALSNAVTVAGNWQVVTDSVAGNRFYRMHFNPPPVPTPTNFEAESLAYTVSDGTVTLTSDAAASGGVWVQYDPSVGIGSYIQFTVPNLSAGNYDLQFFYKKNNPRGQLQVSVDGANVGGVIDEYGASGYASTDCGTVTLAMGGSHLVRLTVTGKNTSSSGYRLSADKFVFLPQ